ncbi:hypothetical protein HUU51_00080 [Candidatus Gracilibacteria bacterium]|nr:hypothetical protein [Candidatus Gracilibacteria bacterium]
MLNTNNIKSLTKISLKIVIFLMGFWSFLGYVSAATIESTSIGGNWSSTGTWIGGVMPGVNDDVTIRGEVILDTYSTIKSLTINENGVIKKDSTLNQQSLTINSDFVNNGEIKGRIEYFYVKGKTVNNGTINNIGNFYIYGDFENNGVFNSFLMLGKDVEITKKLDFANTIYLKGYKLKVPKDSYIKLLVGPGEINSQTSINGNGEKIIIGRPAFNITSNFETVEINEIFTTGIGGMLNSRNVYINNDVYYGSDVIYNGNVIIGDNGRLYKHFSSNTTSMTINGNLINYGILDGLSYAGYTYVNVSGNLLNKGSINYITGGLYIKGNIDNINGNILYPSKTYIKWDNIQDYTNYTLNITDLSDITLNTNQYLLNDNIKEIGTNIYWKVKGKGLIFDSDWSENRCINVSGCVNISLPWEEEQPIQIPTPTNLKQYIQSPLLEKEEIQVGSKIGKFQSGSGVIFELEVDNPESKELKIEVELYEKLSGTTRTFKSGIINSSGIKSFTIPLSKGDYTWKLRLEDTDGNTSDWKEFGNNGTDTDFSIFEGFEPYPYGFKFHNGEPVEGTLKGGISYLSLGENITSKYIRKIEPGNLWDLFYKTFDTSDFVNNDKKLMDAFESVGLINGNVFKGGNCYGLAYLSLLNIYKPDYIEQNFPDFFKKIKNGDLYNSIEVPSTFGNENWDIDNETLKTILTLYLTQQSSQHKRILLESQITPNELLTKLSNPDNKNKLYLLSIYGEDKNGNTKGHTVFLYRVDGNKIYIVDNNVAYPNNILLPKDLNYSYNQYIEINGTGSGTWISQLYSQLGWIKFTDLSLMKIEDLYNGGIKSKPFGFAVNDSLYTLSGSSDIILTDSIGRKSGYLNGEIFKEIPGVLVDIPLDTDVLGNSVENTFKQIYLPEKLENLTIEINGKTDENYDLMIAGGDYYTKLEGITTSSGQTDIFNISRENKKIDFDDNKTGTYNILVDDFQNNSTGSIYLHQFEIIKEKQELSIDWNKVINNENDSITYSVDLNNDGIYDIESTFNSLPKSENETGSISGKVFSSPSNAGYKVCIDSNNNSKCEENIEPFIVTDNTGNYKFDNLDKGDYTIIQETRNNWEIIKPLDKKYTIKLNNGQNIVNLNFENSKINGNKNNKK